MAKEKELSVEALAIARKFLLKEGIGSLVEGHLLRVFPAEGGESSGGGSALIRAVDDPRRGVVLQVEDVRLLPSLNQGYFMDLVHDQAFPGSGTPSSDDPEEIGAEIADAIYVAARAVQLLGRHS